MKKVLTIIFFLVLFSLSKTFVMAEKIVEDPKVWMGQFSASSGLPDPNSFDIKQNAITFVVNFLYVVLIISSFIFMVYGGIKWIISGGSKDGVAKAQKTITYSALGLILGLSIFLIFKIIETTLGITLFTY